MIVSLASCVPDYKCGARLELAWMRDHPKAVDVSSFSKIFYGRACILIGHKLNDPL